MSYETILNAIDSENLGPEYTRELKENALIAGIIDGKTGTIAAQDAGFNTGMGENFIRHHPSAPLHLDLLKFFSIQVE